MMILIKVNQTNAEIEYFQNRSIDFFAAILNTMTSKQNQSKPGSIIIILMNRNSKENIQKNSLFVIGEIQRVKLNIQDKLKRVILTQNSPFKNIRPESTANPFKVFTQGNAMVVIDDNEEGWLVSEPFEGCVNLSGLIKSKISDVYLGEKELIAQTKKGNLLINWGAKKLIEKTYLSKLNTFGTSDYDPLFQVYLITNSFSTDFYFYSPEKKVDNLNRLYFVNRNEKLILGYPTGLTINTRKMVKGLSVGKYYTLCWDQQGKLYSWGSKSLGLGYGQIPSEDFIQNPRNVKLSKNVITAFADCHYSLALTDQGIIYEWGIKRDINEINEQPIFKPKPLEFKYFNCKAKFVALKGKDSNYAVLSSQGQLYVWGNTARNLLSPKIVLPSSWKKAYIYEPVLQTNLLSYHIHDFSIQTGFLAVVAGDSNQTIGNEQYWNGLIKKAKNQLSQFKMIRVNTESEQVRKLKKKYKNSILSESQPKTERIKKGNYLRLTTTIDVPRMTKNISQQNLSQMLERITPTVSSNALPFNTLRIHKRQVSEAPNNFLEKKSIQKLRKSDLGLGIEKMGFFNKRSSKMNQICPKKWQQILQKRKIQPRGTRGFNIKQLDEQNDCKQNDEGQITTKGEMKYILKNTLQKQLIRHYIGGFIKSFLAQVNRQSNQGIYNSEINIDCFQDEETVSQRVIRKIQKLKCKSFIRYTFLMIYFRKYVHDFRKRRHVKNRSKVITQIVKASLLHKINLSLQQLRKKTSKISKLNAWIIFYNKQQRKCLKQLWNNFVIFSYKLKDGGEFNFTHPNPDLTFKEVFTEKKEFLPSLSLQNYMNHKSPHTESNDLKLPKMVTGQFRRRAQNKFQTEKISFTLQVLPYSLHYNYFRKPKNLDINVGEANRTNPSWVQLQKKTLEEYLKQTLFQHFRTYCKKKREYDVVMANFIATYYQTFYEKRWKFIIQYNKLEKTAHKKKKEKELKRLLKMVNWFKLYEEDCIPQKHIVLDQAAKRNDAPLEPQQIYHFDLQTFQQNYKSYVQLLHTKIRTLKKKNK